MMSVFILNNCYRIKLKASFAVTKIRGLWAVSAVLVLVSIWISFSSPALAVCCTRCARTDCSSAEDFLDVVHSEIRERVKTEFDDDLDQFEDWMIEIMFETQIVPAMAAMATQMGAVAMQYTAIIGSFLDAQIQMDTQRLFRKLQFEAHKDYRPSEDFCWFGTNVRSLAATDNIARFNSLALSKISLSRQLGVINMAGSASYKDDYKSRWSQFVSTYCDPGDNNYQGAKTGLELACDHDGPGGTTLVGALDHNRVNRDIDYTRLIEEPRTLDIDFTNNSLDSENTLVVSQPGDEEDVIALSKNLYGHKVLSRSISNTSMDSESAKRLYLTLRSIAAKRGVAQASFNAIVGLKSAGTAHENPGETLDYPSALAPSTRAHKQTARYMAAIVEQLLPPDPSGASGGANIFDLIGYSPSYYSQLEILAKRIYQNPDFYVNLYDTPANVSRKKVAMKAVELMVDRAIYESQLRREMNVSVLLASKLRAAHRNVNRGLSVSIGNE